MKKNKIIILSLSIILIIIIISIVLIIMNFNNKDKENIKDIEEEIKEEKLSIKENIDVEINSNLIDIKTLFNKDIDIYTYKYYLNNEEVLLDTVYDKLGTYELIVEVNNEEFKTTLNVIDTLKPELELKELTVNEGDKYKIEDFVKSCSDNSREECILEYKEDYKYDIPGIYDIVIYSKDSSGNIEEKTTKLTIKEKPKFVETKKEVNKIEKDLKYGVKIIETTTTTYDIYSDGSIKNKKTTTKSTYNYDGYNATTNDLLDEATSNMTTYLKEINEVLEYTNAYRAEVDLEPLTLDQTLTKGAMVRALELSYGNNLSHIRPNGDYCFSVLEELGYPDTNQGENLAWGQSSAKGATTWWRNSPMHYINMVMPYYTKLGVGVMKLNGKYFWVQLFS